MKNIYQKKAGTRTALLLVLFSLWLSGVVFRLVQLQIIESAKHKDIVAQQHQNTEPIIPERGSIFDRNGSILAISLPRESIFFTPFKSEPVSQQMEKIRRLSDILDLSPKRLKIIESRIKKNDPFIWIRRQVDPDKAELVKSLELSGIGFTEEKKRIYPNSSLAAQVIGRVNIDGSGQSGIEYKYNSVLEGERGKRLILRDAKQRKYRLEVIKVPVPGKDIFLTVDETIQYIAERELERGVLAVQAEWGTVIISYPATGEILAMAHFPKYDLNHPPGDILEYERIRAIRHTFAPGSTFKAVTASAAVESGAFSHDEKFDCSAGIVKVAGKTIRDHRRFGMLSFDEVFVHSSNVGTIQIGDRIGEENLYRMITNYGFGRKTGIDLPAEAVGLIRPPERWTTISLSSLSIGYEISVTAIQMLQVINAVANKGRLYPPKVVKQISGKDSEELLPFKQVIPENTAAQITALLHKVVLEGTGQKAWIDGYPAAGKTGTAQKYDREAGRFSSEMHIASFVGFIPVNDPKISMIIVIDNPKGVYYGGDVAAPVFREISSQVLHYLRVPRQTTLKEKMITARKQAE